MVISLHPCVYQAERSNTNEHLSLPAATSIHMQAFYCLPLHWQSVTTFVHCFILFFSRSVMFGNVGDRSALSALIRNLHKYAPTHGIYSSLDCCLQLGFGCIKQNANDSSSSCVFFYNGDCVSVRGRGRSTVDTLHKRCVMILYTPTMWPADACILHGTPRIFHEQGTGYGNCSAQFGCQFLVLLVHMTERDLLDFSITHPPGATGKCQCKYTIQQHFYMHNLHKCAMATQHTGKG